jgi:putative transposase
MKHAVKVRIYPNDEQQVALSKAFGCARWFWNNSLAINTSDSFRSNRGSQTLDGYRDDYFFNL